MSHHIPWYELPNADVPLALLVRSHTDPWQWQGEHLELRPTSDVIPALVAAFDAAVAGADPRLSAPVRLAPSGAATPSPAGSPTGSSMALPPVPSLGAAAPLVREVVPFVRAFRTLGGSTGEAGSPEATDATTRGPTQGVGAGTAADERAWRSARQQMCRLTEVGFCPIGALDTAAATREEAPLQVRANLRLEAVLSADRRRVALLVVAPEWAVFRYLPAGLLLRVALRGATSAEMPAVFAHLRRFDPELAGQEFRRTPAWRLTAWSPDDLLPWMFHEDSAVRGRAAELAQWIGGEGGRATEEEPQPGGTRVTRCAPRR